MPDYASLIDQIKTCDACTLSKERTQAVPGNGSTDADIFFIGEGPGFYEDREGVPFVGRAGALLNRMLDGIGIRRDDVYVTNMVKCRPPNNRDPLPAEIESCKPFLDEQLNMVRPKVIVTLGRYSFSKFFPGEAISRARGKPRSWNGLVVYPMYHPAAALRNSKFHDALQRDFSALPELVREVSERQYRPPDPAPQPAAKQLGMFG